MKKILIVSDLWACDTLTAGIALKKFITSVSSFSEISTFITIDKSFSNQIPEALGLGKNYFIRKPNEFWDGPKLIHRLLSPFISYFTIHEVDLIHKRLKAVLDELNPDHIVFVLQGQTSIMLARESMSHGFDYSTITWDPWSWWAASHQVPKNIDAYVIESLIHIYSRGKHLVPTRTFSLVNRIKEDSFRVIYFPELEANRQEHIKIPESQIHIVFSGQNYASEELSMLIDALSTICWRFEGKEIFLNIVGAKVPNTSPNIVNHGWVHYSKLPEFLTRFHVAFLPYPMKSELSEVATQSFPSKVSSYTSAALPIIYLGPKDSEVHRLISDFSGELQVRDQKVSNLEEVLGKIQSNYLSLSDGSLSAYLEHFSLSPFETNIYDWGVSVNLISNPQKVPKTLEKKKPMYENLGVVSGNTLLLRRVQILFSSRILNFMKFLILRLIFKVRYICHRCLLSIGISFSYVYVKKFQLKSQFKPRGMRK